MTPIPFLSMTIGPPIPEIQFDLGNSRSKAKANSQRSVLLTHFLSVSHQGILSTPVLFLSMTIRPPVPEIKFDLENSRSKVKVESTPVSAVSHYLSVSHQGILSTPVPFVPWQSGLPFLRYNLNLKKLKVKGQNIMYPSQHIIQLTSFLFVSHQLDEPFLRYGTYKVRLQKTDLKFYAKKSLKNLLAEFLWNLIRWKSW